MKTTQILRHIIAGLEGATVADQFYAVFDKGESMDDQNINALRYTHIALKMMYHSTALLSVRNDIEEYINELTTYLQAETV